MKRFLSLALVVFVTTAFSVTTVFAQQGNKAKAEQSAGTSVVSTVPTLDELINGHENDEDYLKGLIKKHHREKETRKALLKKFVDVKKANNDDSMPIFLNGTRVESDVPPVIKGDRMLIPVRAVTNALGAEVLWNEDTRTVAVTKAVYGAVYGQTSSEISIKIEIKLDSNIVLVNGVQTEIDVPAQLVSNRTMVPLRFIAETFKKLVEWDEGSKSVLIDENKNDKDDGDKDKDEDNDKEFKSPKVKQSSYQEKMEFKYKYVLNDR